MKTNEEIYRESSPNISVITLMELAAANAIAQLPFPSDEEIEQLAETRSEEEYSLWSDAEKQVCYEEYFEGMKVMRDWIFAKKDNLNQTKT